MKKLSNKNKEALKDRKLCILNRQGNRIIFKIGPNTTLTAIRDFIKNNASKIKAIQNEIRTETGIKLTERDRKRDKKWRDKLIYDFSKKSIKELRLLIKDLEVRRMSENTKYKDEIIAKIMNEGVEDAYLYGIEPEYLTADNVRKIISRQRMLFLQRKM